MSRLLALYAQALKLCPKAFRDHYARPMLQTMEDMLHDQPSRAARCAMWFRATLDLPVSITQLNTTVIGESLVNDTPHYVKRASTAGGFLLIPFIVIIASGVLKNRQISHSQPWIISLFICLIALPALAFLLNVASYITWFKAAAKRQHSVVGRLLNIRHTWPMLVAGSLGLVLCLFVPFHDSAHCVIGNSVRVIHNPHQTIQCIDNGFMGSK